MAVLVYIKLCMDNVKVDKSIRIYLNRKPWMTSAVQSLIRSRSVAFKSRDTEKYSAARFELKRGVKKAKMDYKKRTEDHLESNNMRQVLQGLQHLINYRASKVSTPEGDAALAEKLNNFFARFEVQNCRPRSL